MVLEEVNDVVHPYDRLAPADAVEGGELLELALVLQRFLQLDPPFRQPHLVLVDRRHDVADFHRQLAIVVVARNSLAVQDVVAHVLVGRWQARVQELSVLHRACPVRVELGNDVFALLQSDLLDHRFFQEGQQLFASDVAVLVGVNVLEQLSGVEICDLAQVNPELLDLDAGLPRV